MNKTEFSKIEKKALSMLAFDPGIKVLLEESECFCVSKNSDKLIIKGKRITDFYRGFMLAYVEISKGNNNFDISETRHFDELGFSLDLSRNGVIKVEKIKDIIDVMALCGFTYIQLYMEDVFDLPGYPHFGYRRGKYTHEELKEIDDYAYSMGIEAVPSVQTLGHLGQYLRYKEASKFAENPNVLLCGAEETYDFIEAIVKTMRSCFRTKRLTINCDEAGGVGNKKIRAEKKYIRPYSVIVPHLRRVMEICNKYDFKVNVCGDLFYGHLGKGYYDFDFQKPSDEVIKDIPEIDIVFWDYYHTNYNDYNTLIKGHKFLERNLIFWGGIWAWSGQLPNAKFTFETMEPALRSCIDNGIKDVLAANYCDDGNETNIAFSLPQLLLYSEFCFKGDKYKREDVFEQSKHFFKFDMNILFEVSSYHYPWIEGLERYQYIWPNYMGKRLFYSDVFYNMCGTYDYTLISEKHNKALNYIKDAQVGSEWQSYYDYIINVFEITTEKMDVITGIKEAYDNKDNKKLLEISENNILSLIGKYKKLMMLHEEQWLNMYKPFGWEELNIRYAGTIARLEYAKRTIDKYLNSDIDSIPELEFEFIEEPEGNLPAGGCITYNQIKSTGL